MVEAINTVLCILIIILGIGEYGRKGNKLSLALAIAYALFGISHIMSSVGLAQSKQGLIVAVRVSAYVIVAAAMYLTREE